MDDYNKNNFRLNDDHDDYEEASADYTQDYEQSSDSYDLTYDEEDYTEDNVEDYEDSEYYDEYEEVEEPYEYETDDSATDAKLGMVLDELNQLKRSMGANQQPQYLRTPRPVPQSVSGQPATDIGVYNEISKLRSELGKAQLSHKMQEELSKLKDQLERDARQNEVGLLAEIKRLQDKIDDLSNKEPAAKNSLSDDEIKRLIIKSSKSSRQDDTPKVVVAQAPQANLEEVFKRELNKLININEDILRSVSDTGRNSLTQISELKQKVDRLPDFSGIKEDVASLKETFSEAAATNNVSTYDPALMDELKNIKHAVQDIQIPVYNGAGEVTVQSDPRVLQEVKELRNIMARQSAMDRGAGGVDLSAISDKLTKLNAQAVVADNSEILRQIYEIKVLVGSQNSMLDKRNKAVLELFNEFNKLKVEADSKVISLSDKLYLIDEFAKKLATTNEPEAYELFQSLSLLNRKLLNQKLDKKTLLALKQFAHNTDSIHIPMSKHESAKNYVELLEAVNAPSVSDAISHLRDLVDSINMIQNHKNATQNDSLYGEILDLADVAMMSDGGENLSITREIKQKIDQLCNLTAADFIDFKPAMPSRVHKQAPMIEGGGLVDKLSELKSVVAGANFATSDNDGNVTTNSPSMAIVLQEIDALKKELTNLVSQDAVLNAVIDLQQSTFDIQEKLNAIAGGELKGEAVNSVLIEDIEYIKEKVSSNSEVVAAIAEIRADIAELIHDKADINNVEQEEKTPVYLEEALNSLYDDFAKLMDESREPIVHQLNSINDSIATLDESISVLNELGMQIAENVENVKTTELEELLKILVEDVADIKKQVLETSSIVNSNSPTNDVTAQKEEEINHYKQLLRDQENLTHEQSEAIQGQLDVLLDEVAAMKEGMATQDMPDAEDLIKEESISLALTEISDKLSTLLYDTGSDEDGSGSNNIQLMIADISSMLGDISEIKEKVYAIDETVLAELNKISSALNVVNKDAVDENDALSEVVATTPIGESVATILDDLSIIKDKVGMILDHSPSGLDEVRESINTSRTREMAEISAELDKILSEIQQLKLDVSQLGEIRQEITSCRDDIKTKDLEYANDLPSVNDVGLILDELAVLREELKLVQAGATVPNNDEINLLVSEVVALRDEIKSYREEFETNENVRAVTRTIPLSGDEEGLQQTMFDDDGNEIIIQKSQTADIIPSTTALLIEQNQELQAQNAVLADEIKSIKELLTALVENVPTRKSKMVALDETDIDGLHNIITGDLTDIDNVAETTVDGKDAQYSLILEELASLRSEMITKEADGDMLEQIVDDLAELKDQLNNVQEEVAVVASAPRAVVASVKTSDEIQEGSVMATAETVEAINETYSVILEEISSLRAEIAEVKNTNKPTKVVVSSDSESSIDEAIVIAINEKVDTIFETINQPDHGVLTEVLELRSEFQAIKDELVAKSQEAGPSNEELSSQIIALNNKVSILCEELEVKDTNLIQSGDNNEQLAEVCNLVNQLCDDITSMKSTQATGEGSSEQLSEVCNLVNQLSDDIASIKAEKYDSIDDELYAKIDSLKEEIIAVKESSVDDYVVKDLLAEVKSLKADVANIAVDSKANDEVLAEIQTLRDQFFAINMARIEGGDTQDFESYNNIILDEINALRDQVKSVVSNSQLIEVQEKLKDIYAKLDDKGSSYAIEQKLEVLAESLQNIDIKSTQIDSLKDDLAKNLAANEALVNYMSSVSELVEKQNKQIVAISGLSEQKFDDLKQEIAASVATKYDSSSTEKAVKEIAKIKDEIVKGSNKNDDSEKVLKEIRRVKEDIEFMLAKESKQEVVAKDTQIKALADDLKQELNYLKELALSEDESSRKVVSVTATAKKAPAKKPATKKATPAKKTTSTGTAKKATAKATAKKENSSSSSSSSKQTKKATVTATATKKPVVKKAITVKKQEDKPLVKSDSVGFSFNLQEETESLISKIQRESESLDLEFNLSDSGFIPRTADELDLAARLAKQVANKLVMEQLVHQLGDGGVPQSQVEEIVKDILPQEFTTIQIDEQSDKVRRLANSMVLDKLRAKLIDRNTKDKK